MNMEKAGFRLGVILCVLVMAGAPLAALDVPLLSELRKPVEEKPVEVEAEPIAPSAVSPERRVNDPAVLCPEGAVWYMAVPDATRLRNDWEVSPAGELAADPAIARMFRNNRFGLNFLFSDLPVSIITPQRVGAAAGALELARAIAGMSEDMSMACYIDPDGEFQFLFLFDVGLVREPAFDLMKDWETSFLVSNPGTKIQRGDHSGNYIDIWTLRAGEESLRSADVAAGFAENMAVVSNNATLAASCLNLLSGGASIADSRWGKRLAASVPVSGAADVVGFVRMDAMLEGLDATPIAKNAVLAWADLVGSGGGTGEALYYGLQFVKDGSRETYLLPNSNPIASPSLLELLGKRLQRPPNGWTTPSVMPYQPNPSLYVAAMLDGRQLGGWLRQERRLFGQSPSYAFDVPESVRPIFTNEVITLLTGEIGIAFFPSPTGSDWLMVLPTRSNPDSLLARATSMVDRASATIRSAAEDWRNSPAWTTASPGNFRRLTGSYLFVASRGDVLLSTIDQLAAGTSFAANRDFIRAMSQAEAEQGLLFYLNIPEVLVREYPNLSSIMRSVYPRSSGFNSRPPLALLRRYAKGLLGVIAPAGENGEFTRLTIQAPMPSFGALVTSVVLRFPMSLRADGRAAMAKSRENMQGLWMRLQLYSSRFGHFPESLADLAADMRLNTPDDEIRSMMVAPAALSRMPSSEAATASYRYLSGVTPNDEPDIPLIYEAQPWSEDFAGMYPTEPNRAPAERGDFQQYRQFIRLDGTVVTMPEKRFQDIVVPRLADRE